MRIKKKASSSGDTQINFGSIKLPEINLIQNPKEIINSDTPNKNSTLDIFLGRDNAQNQILKDTERYPMTDPSIILYKLRNAEQLPNY